MSLRRLIQYYDQRLLDAWDHTATVATMVYNLTAVVNNAVNKTKIHPIEISEANPYRKKKQRGLAITPENFHRLKGVVQAMHGRRGPP